MDHPPMHSLTLATVTHAWWGPGRRILVTVDCPRCKASHTHMARHTHMGAWCARGGGSYKVPPIAMIPGDVMPKGWEQHRLRWAAEGGDDTA